MHDEQIFYKKAALKNFAIFTEKHLRWSLFLKKNAGLHFWNFIKKMLQHRCFPVNITKFLRTAALKKVCQRLFERFATWANNTTSNIGSEEDIFSKTKHKKHSKTQLDEKETCLFMMFLMIILFFSISPPHVLGSVCPI